MNWFRWWRRWRGGRWVRRRMSWARPIGIERADEDYIDLGSVQNYERFRG